MARDWTGGIGGRAGRGGTLRARAVAVALAALAGWGAAPAPALADGTGLVFRAGQLENVETGAEVVYRHTRVAPAAAERPETAEGQPAQQGTPAALRQVEDGRIVLSLVSRPGAEAQPARAAVLVLEGDEGRSRTLDPFPGGPEAGNPVLLAFLEMTARAVAEATGGSPFYIRNRIKDAFRAGGETSNGTVEAGGETLSVTRVAYRPFVGDPNRDRLGAFEGLTITFDVAETAPGGFVRLLASTGGTEALYREEIALAGAGAAGSSLQ